MFKVKRVYELADPEDGARVLVDRLWPRGVSKTKAKMNLWLRDAAPSGERRRSSVGRLLNFPLREDSDFSPNDLTRPRYSEAAKNRCDKIVATKHVAIFIPLNYDNAKLHAALQFH